MTATSTGTGRAPTGIPRCRLLEWSQTAATVVPGSTALTEMREALHDVPVEMHYADRAAFFARIDPAVT